MKRTARNTLLAVAGATVLAASVQVTAHMDTDEPMQAYRQSYFNLVAMNFGPIGKMLKGEMEWDDAKVKMFASELGALGSMDVGRAFAPGTDKGTTRAKPGIWENKDDFTAKLNDMREALASLSTAAESGDKKAIGAAAGAAGKSCKSCHDEYKSKEYLY
ncbi:cytochrome c [Halioglobus maricola]|uniref:Cytochrome c n=1 Tax=Halioglobus maricola TaxID=2601894 RepID=A0A5P9NJT7_9GAMM|nr:cytochrome c [Halioglobus maricola]QFU75494.1 cytochrome c [Halioglobus maricola]